MYIAQAGANAAAMGAGEQRLNFLITATNMATPGIAAVSAGFANLTAIGMRTSTALTEAMTPLAGGLMAAGGAAALAMGYATVKAAQFEQQMKYVQSVTSLTNTQISSLSESVKSVAMQYGVSAGDIAGSLSEIGRAGIDDATIQMQIFTSALKMAKIEGIDMNYAIQGVMSQAGMFGTSYDDPNFGKKVEEITKTMVHASQIGPATISQLMMATKYAGGAAASAGWTPEQLYGTITYMSSKGVSGEIAGTALRGLIQKTTMGQPGFKKAMSSLGLTDQDLWPGGDKLLAPDQLFKTITEAMDKKGLSQQEKIGLWTQIAQQKTSQQLLKIKPEELTRYMNKMKETFDVDKQVAIAMDSAMEQFNRLKATLEVAFINLGNVYLPFIRGLVDGLQGLFEGFSKNEMAIKAFSVALAGALFMGILMIGKWVAAIGTYMVGTLKFYGDSAATLGARLTGVQASTDAAMIAQNRMAAEASRVSEAFVAEGVSIDRATAAYGRMSAISGVVSGMPVGGAMGRGAVGPMGARTWAQLAEENLAASGAMMTPIPMGGRKMGPKELRNVEIALEQELARMRGPEATRLAQKGLKPSVFMDPEKSKLLAQESATLEKRMAAQEALLVTSGMGAIPDVNRAEGASRMARLRGFFSLAPQNSLLVKSGLVKMGEGAEAGASGLKALGLSAFTVLPLLIALAAIVTALYLSWKSYYDWMEKINKKLEENREKVNTVSGELDELRKKREAATGTVEITTINKQIVVKEEELATAREGVRSEFEYKAGYERTGWEGMKTPWAGTKASEGFGPYAGYFGTTGSQNLPQNVGYDEYMKLMQIMTDAKPDLQTYAANIDYIDKVIAKSDPKKAAELRRKEEEKLQNKYGMTIDEIKEYNRALTLNWQQQAANVAWWKAFWSILSSITNLIMSMFGMGRRNSEAAKETDKASKTVNSHADAMKAMNDNVQTNIDAIYEWIYSIQSMVGWLDKVAQVIQFVMMYAANPSGGREGLDRSLKEFREYKPQDKAAWMEANKPKPIDTAGWLNTEALPGGIPEEGAAGAGKDAAVSGKTKIAAPYSVEFILCSKKALPPLDPNIFKSKPIVDLTQKTFKVDNIHINTRDKPEIIESTMKRAIVSISDANRVNPTIKNENEILP